MSKVMTFLCLIISTAVMAQDSVKITITPQARDLEYIASFIYHDNNVEDLYDSVKATFRKPNPPTGTTTVEVTAETHEWFYLIKYLKNDGPALRNNTASRLETLLKAAGQVYLNNKITELDNLDAQRFTDMRQFGRQKLRKIKQ